MVRALAIYSHYYCILLLHLYKLLYKQKRIYKYISKKRIHNKTHNKTHNKASSILILIYSVEVGIDKYLHLRSFVFVFPKLNMPKQILICIISKSIVYSLG